MSRPVFSTLSAPSATGVLGLRLRLLKQAQNAENCGPITTSTTQSARSRHAHNRGPRTGPFSTLLACPQVQPGRTLAEGARPEHCTQQKLTAPRSTPGRTYDRRGRAHAALACEGGSERGACEAGQGRAYGWGCRGSFTRSRRLQAWPGRCRLGRVCDHELGFITCTRKARATNSTNQSAVNR